MLPTCKSVLKGVCGEVSCRSENGQKPCIILIALYFQTLKVSEIDCSSDNVDDSLNYSSDSSVTSDMVDSIDLANELPVTVNSDKVFVAALWLKLAPPTQKSKIHGKWFAGIYTIGKKVSLYAA